MLVKGEKLIGIIILNYNTYNDVFTCVESIFINTVSPFRIYIVDNASNDDSYDKIKTAYKNNERIKIIKAEKNKGYSSGNNIGIRKALEDKCEELCILNADVILVNNAIDIMNEKMRLPENYDTAVIGPSIKDHTAVEAQFARKKYKFKDFIVLKKPLCNIAFISKLSDRYIKWNNTQDFKFQGMISGCCFLIKSKLFENIGLFDERVFLYGEEDILAYKLDCLKYKTMITTKAKIYHNANSSTQKKGTAFITYYLWLSAAIVLRSYGAINDFKLAYVILFNSFGWIGRSVFNLEYRKKIFEFIRDNIALFSLEAGAGLKCLKKE